MMATRFSWELHKGPIPPGLDVLHTCDIPACCNPAHLWLGNDQDNMDDMARKGRSAHSERSGRAKLTAAQVSEIKRTYIPHSKGEFNTVGLAKKFGVKTCSIWAILHGLNWKYHKE